jgi:hypothetical protein
MFKLGNHHLLQGQSNMDLWVYNFSAFSLQNMRYHTLILGEFIHVFFVYIGEVVQKDLLINHI